MQIEIINVSAPQTPAGKKYKFVEVAYKKDGAVEGKKLLDFANPAIFKDIQTLKQGDVIEVNTVKNEKGYWDWTGFSKGNDGTPSTSASSGNVRETTKPTVSNYETKEERAQRQKYIIRQSSLSNALTFYDGKKVDEATVLALAEKFVDWVYDVPFATIKKDPVSDFDGDEDLVL